MMQRKLGSHTPPCHVRMALEIGEGEGPKIFLHDFHP